MKIVAISDSHGQHHSLKQLPPGDMLIHAGDVSSRGGLAAVTNFLIWFSKQDYKYKIFIAGNHDFLFERETTEFIKSLIPKDVIYLNDSGIEIEGINIWGSPVQPWFHDWAFNRMRGDDIQKHWDLIPTNTDILITHGPPMKVLDITVHGHKHVGCQNLMDAIQKVKPKVHIFGHIHEAYGVEEQDGIKFINASVLNLQYELVNAPVLFNYE